MDYQTALITGASSGIGRGLAKWFASQGVTVYAAARRTAELDSLRREAGDAIVPFPLDVAKADQAHEQVAALDAEVPLDLVIANAGVGGDTNGRHLDWPHLKRLLDVNVTGAAATIAGALPGMVARKQGHVVGIASIAAFVALPKSSAYCASKAFLTMFLDGLRLDVERVGVTVTSIHPGFVKSEMTAKATFKMPFLLETEDAAVRIGKAIVAKKRRFLFPWQMSALASTATTMPFEVQRALSKQLR